MTATHRTRQRRAGAKGTAIPNAQSLDALPRPTRTPEVGRDKQTEPRPNALRLSASLLASHPTRLPGGPDTYLGRYSGPYRPDTPNKEQRPTRLGTTPILPVGLDSSSDDTTPDLVVDLEPFSRGLGCCLLASFCPTWHFPSHSTPPCDDTLPRAIPPPSRRFSSHRNMQIAPQILHALASRAGGLLAAPPRCFPLLQPPSQGRFTATWAAAAIWIFRVGRCRQDGNLDPQIRVKCRNSLPIKSPARRRRRGGTVPIGSVIGLGRDRP